jgi:hypothetical protein
MQAIRMRVRTVALAWLLCQAGSLAAFVPENCCLAHANERAAKEQGEPCHESEPVEPQPGDACPMHHSKPADCCVMSSACDGPGRHLTTLFAYHTTLDRPPVIETLLESSFSLSPAAPPQIHRPTTPDAPPPKA